MENLLTDARAGECNMASDSVASEEPVTPQRRGRSPKILENLSRSGMDSQPPPLDASLEIGMVVANLDLNPWGGTSELHENVSIDHRGSSSCGEVAASPAEGPASNFLGGEDHDVDVSTFDDVKLKRAMIEARIL
ncbi:hypothetical protein Nepgr_024691 [Nepenthes gracilis]|uniref:Uncharacterized protein n=1 Tax=Nepenthes gracilis TaxID=150966 RepID=A0AAD3T3B2_NEPGR|nr:hypothetical protein Nepgr_024691 [Nepenthes gracilis]